MVHISCTWQNNDSSSSPIVITCNCSKAIYWGRGGTRGVSPIKIIIGEGGVLGAPGNLLGKESAGETWSPRTPPHTEPGESCCFSLAARENRWRRCQRGLGEGDGRLCHPTAKEKRSLASWRHVAHCAVPQPAERWLLCSRGCAKSRSLQMPAKARGTLLVNY